MPAKEFLFTPRIINPVKIQNVVIFSADEQIRQTKRVLDEHMPWINVEILSDPFSVTNFQSEGATILILDDVGMNLVDTTNINKRIKDVIILLLSANELVHCSPPSFAAQKFPYTAKADLVFAFNKTDCTPNRIIQSIVRAAEDMLNVAKYSRVRRFIFLIVDDEPRWFSQFLPILYDIIGQRADVKIARTLEESLRFLFGVETESEIDEKQYISRGHGDDVICLITDIFFPKGSNLKSDAGKDLVRIVQKFYPRIPIIIASKTKEAEVFRDTAFILPKGDPDSLITLKSYIQDYTGIGDFFIRDRDGRVLYRVKNIQEMTSILEHAEKDSKEAQELRDILEEAGKKDGFSTWLYMHSFRELGDVLRPMRAKGRRLVTVLKRHLKREELRMASTPLVVDGKKACTLEELLESLSLGDPAKIQVLSDNDIISSWLDRRGYSELAEELRPIHGTGKSMIENLTSIVEKWMKVYNKNPQK